MAQRVTGVLGAWIAGSLMFGSTAAMASPPMPSQANPWAVLSVMSGGASAAALCGAAAATAAQAPTGCVLPALDAAPPPAQAAPPPPAPVPPISAPSAGLGINPLILGLLALAASVG